mgnify:CR=1 FL=1
MLHLYSLFETELLPIQSPSFVEFHIYRVLPDPRDLWMLELFEWRIFISDIRANRRCKIQPVKGHQ